MSNSKQNNPDLDFMAQMESALPLEELLPRLSVMLIQKEVLMPFKKLKSGAQSFVMSDLILEYFKTEKHITASLFLKMIEKLCVNNILFACKTSHLTPEELHFFFITDWNTASTTEKRQYTIVPVDLLMKQLYLN